MILLSPGDVVGPASSAFYIDETEVTTDRFRQFARTTSYVTDSEATHKAWVIVQGRVGLESVSIEEYEKWKMGVYGDRPPGDLPARQVSHRDAEQYAKWAGCDLPTEAQFEFALRIDSGGGRYPWGEVATPPKRGVNCCDASFLRKFPDSAPMSPLADYDDSFPAAAPVGSMRPNSVGLYDISGNVSEWCRLAATVKRGVVWLWPRHRSAPSYEAPIRGGGWAGDPASTLLVEDRSDVSPWSYSENIGFRCVRDVSTIGSQEIGD